MNGFGFGVTTSEVNGLRGSLREKGLSMSEASIVPFLVTKLEEVTKQSQLLQQQVDELRRNNTMTSDKVEQVHKETSSLQVMKGAKTRENVKPNDPGRKQPILQENQTLLHGSRMCTKKSVGLSNKDEIVKREISNSSKVTLPRKQLLKNHFGQNVRVNVDPMIKKVQDHQINEHEEELQEVLREVTNLKDKEIMTSTFQLPLCGEQVKDKSVERDREFRKRKERERSKR